MSHGSTERFSLRVTPAVRRALAERLPESVAFAAFKFVNGPLLDAPHCVGRRLLPPLDDRHSARRGSYRIIYRIGDKARTVTIVDIDHRSAGYNSRVYRGGVLGRRRRPDDASSDQAVRGYRLVI